MLKMNFNQQWKDLINFVNKNSKNLYCSVPYNNRKHEMLPLVTWIEAVEKEQLNVLPNKKIQMLEEALDQEMLTGALNSQNVNNINNIDTVVTISVDDSTKEKIPVLCLFNKFNKLTIEVTAEQVDTITITTHQDPKITEYTIKRRTDIEAFGGDIYITKQKMREEKFNKQTRPRLKTGVAQKVLIDSRK